MFKKEAKTKWMEIEEKWMTMYSSRDKAREAFGKMLDSHIEAVQQRNYGLVYNSISPDHGLMFLSFVSTEAKENFAKTTAYEEFKSDLFRFGLGLELSVAGAFERYEKEVKTLDRLFQDHNFQKVMGFEAASLFELRRKLLEDARFRAVQALLK